AGGLVGEATAAGGEAVDTRAVGSGGTGRPRLHDAVRIALRPSINASCLPIASSNQPSSPLPALADQVRDPAGRSRPAVSSPLPSGGGAGGEGRLLPSPVRGRGRGWGPSQLAASFGETSSSAQIESNQVMTSGWSGTP